jgi:hypothetical protein
MIEILLRHGADVNGNWRRHRGGEFGSPLHSAAKVIIDYQGDDWTFSL